MSRPYDSLIDQYLLKGVPYYSAHDSGLHDELTKALSGGLGVSRPNIGVVGSARIGFSLSPTKFGEPFNPHSDIDVLVVSPRLFDLSWLEILGHNRNARLPVRKHTRTNLDRHRDKHYVYKGWIYPENILEVLEIGQRWQKAFKRLSQITDLASRTVNARLYRTWEHARLYHRRSFAQLRAKLQGPYS